MLSRFPVLHGVMLRILAYSAVFVVLSLRATAAVLTGLVSAPDARVQPQRITVRVQLVGSAEELVREAAVKHGRWRCDVPSGQLDVELRAPGFAPVYRWSVRSDGVGEIDLGTIAFRNGVALSGKVADRRGVPVARARVTVMPATTLLPELLARDKFRARTKITNGRGDFSFEDLPPDPHVLRIEKEEFSVSSRRIGVDAPAVRLGTLTLVRLTTVRVVLTPPADFYGRPWVVQLTRTSADPRYRETVRSSEAKLSGEWNTPQIDAGDYELRVLTSRNETVHKERLEVSDDPLVNVRVEAVPIRGRVTLAGEGIAANVQLIKADGSSIEFASDDHGDFSGSVTGEGIYRARVRTTSPDAELHLDDIAVRRQSDDGIARVSVDLGDRRIRGKITDSDGVPLPGSVLLFRNGRLEANCRTSPSAEFEFIGLRKATYDARAMTKEGSSAITPLSPTDDDTVYTLIVQSKADVSGRVIDSRGNPVIGATVLARWDDGDAEHTVAGLSGDFTIHAPRASRSMSVAVVADGYPRKLVAYDRTAIGSSDLIIRLTGEKSQLRLRFPPSVAWPFVAARGTSPFVLFSLFVPQPGPPVEFSDGTFTLDVEPDQYFVCPGRVLTAQCTSVTLRPNETRTVAENSGIWR